MMFIDRFELHVYFLVYPCETPRDWMLSVSFMQSMTAIFRPDSVRSRVWGRIWWSFTRS